MDAHALYLLATVQQSETIYQSSWIATLYEYCIHVNYLSSDDVTEVPRDQCGHQDHRNAHFATHETEPLGPRLV